MSSMVDYNDRATCPLFGDAAACMLLEPTEEPLGVMDGIFHVDGSGLEHLVYKAGGSALPTSHETVDANFHCVYQEGRAVYRHAVIDMLTSSRDVMERNNLTNENIQWFVPHQANARIIGAAADRLGIAEDRVVLDLAERANTSAASIPLALESAQRLGRLTPGSHVLLAGVGAGLGWSTLFLRWDR
jgi:3-oxoacyl-[acyl-carrier-protein] synthase-3